MTPSFVGVGERMCNAACCLNNCLAAERAGDGSLISLLRLALVSRYAKLLFQ